MEPSRQAASKSDTHVTFRQGFQDTNYIGITIGDQQDEGAKSKTMNKGPPPPPPPQHIGTPLDYRHSFNGFSRTKTTTNTNRQQQQQPSSTSSSSSSSLSRHASISLPAINTNLHPPPQQHHIPSLSATTAAAAGSPMLSPRYPGTPTYQQQQSSPLYSPLRSAPPLSPIYRPTSPIKSGAFWKIKSSSSSSLSSPYPFSLRATTTATTSSSNNNKPLLAMTRNLSLTYQQCNQGFKYNSGHNPRRVLTKPSKPAANDGYDNEDYDYILYVNDILGGAQGHKYVILDVLGAGTFGQVVKCKNIKTQQIVAVKVVKNKTAYSKQSMMEVAILEMLNNQFDPEDQHHILRLMDTFIHHKHLCLVFELLSVNLYELIKQNQFRGLSTNLVRVFTAQILDAMTVLNEARIIHCDLKPENILLKNLESPTIKVIDFGSACHEAQTMYTYIQSRFYRSPEVLVGLPYTSAIDMWSLGCIATELFLGLPLFPGSSEYNQVSRIVEMLGVPPNYMIEMGKNAHRYFERYIDENGEKKYRLRSLEQYSREQGKMEQPSKRYFSAKTLPDLINNYPIMRKASMTAKEIEKEKQSRLAFIDFLQGLLNLNHFERWSPQQAKQHPFITGEEFTGPFKPAPYTPRKPAHSPIKIHHPPPPPQPQQPTLPVILDEAASSPYMAPISEYDHPQNNSHRFFSGSYSSSSGAATTAYSSSLPNYYTHNSMFFPMRQSTENQPSASTSSSSIQPPRLLHHRGSYNGMSLPRVLEPPDGLATCYEGMPTTTTTTTTTTSASSNSIQSGIMIPPPPPTSTTTTSTTTTTTTTSGRPRASTLGSMQVPPPIQLVSADVAGELPLFTTPRNHHPYRQHTQQQDSLFYPSSSSIKQHPVTSAASSSSGPSSDWDCWDKVDLERDGDWKEQVPHSRRSSYHSNHRRSNSSVQLSDMMPSRSHSMVHSLHRRVRGHPPPYARQDLEWDGIISSSFEPAIHGSNSSSSNSAAAAAASNRSSRQQRWSQQQHEKTGWTMA
ncbi:kinase-like protein [Lichtheimia corymbifera JMRC:FSU:9682]|uniref:Kinase-like protein n=1 Tax=Lichtheimia corymbifera JMRC:FSU:9682 TaxID=1263082 RepID=A0A068SEJ3_9FUNG|nr:kinase-like protein [Lichtheimia corymbifera JMRC:FSU:9682]